MNGKITMVSCFIIGLMCSKRKETTDDKNNDQFRAYPFTPKPLPSYKQVSIRYVHNIIQIHKVWTYNLLACYKLVMDV